MTASAALTSDLQRQVLLLEDDLRARLAADPEREGRWKQEHRRAVENERTDSSWVTWRDDRITQVAVAWVLTTVFIRFCEDNGLLGPVWIAGPGTRRQEALDAQLAFFREHPEDTDREWLLDAVGYLSGLPATRSLVESHSALHLIEPSGGAAGKLLEFWRRRGDDGVLVHDLADPSLSARFLGDLYQDLSQHAKDTFALLQTPVFVEEFILDQTMESALAERPLEGFKLIDPACGSGHFLLGAFDRLLDRWHRYAPDLETQARVQAALDAIHGVDLNPFAIAIARFRLTLAALRACALASLEKAPAFSFHLAAGDSLIHGPDPDVLPGTADISGYMPFTYPTEDRDLLLALLEEGRYDVVVGNPPYITVKDKALNKIYRAKYADVCKGTYAMTVPFMRLFYALAKSGQLPGWTGQITSNSFMKREFGSRLIENFLAHCDLRLVADTSGAYIPGHGTPTVILVGRNQAPVESTVRAVLGIRGEPGRPKDPAEGLVWSRIAQYVNTPGWDDGWITVTDLDRGLLAVHPWSLTGGAAVGLQQKLMSHRGKLRSRVRLIGRTCHTGSDETYFADPNTWKRFGLKASSIIPMITGDVIRDWGSSPNAEAAFPYGPDLKPDVSDAALHDLLWRSRTILRSRLELGGTTESLGMNWYEWSRWHPDRFLIKLGICFAFVATHNHFAFDRGGKVFNRSAPVIKLRMPADEGEHFAILGLLNSSVACFWLKQTNYAGGGDPVGVDGARVSREKWSERYQFNSGPLEELPLPKYLPGERGQVLNSLQYDLAQEEPEVIAVQMIPEAQSLTAARVVSERIRADMIAQQEELDWQVYWLYGLIDEDLTYSGNDIPGIVLGERAFEIVLARAVRDGQEETAWFTRHGSTPITEIPSYWPAEYQKLVQRRIDLIGSEPFIRLLERPEYKRRWAQESWEKRQERALREWLLDRMEDRSYWFDPQGRPRPRSVGQLADEVGRDDDFTSVLALWEGRPDVPVTQSLVRLLADEAVPFLAAYRYKDSGLRKWEAWEQMWSLQRLEDAGKNVGKIDVPPKYTSADFRKASYWAARGKLDVPKERFILYPDAGRETDPTPLLGWAGWDHAQQSLALALIISERERDGWADERLIPLVAGLAELQPWVDQWHSEIDLAYGVSPAAFCREQLTARAVQVSKTLDQLVAWRPVPAGRGRGRGAGKTAARAKGL